MKTLFAVALLLPTLAAAERCKVEKAEELALDLAGVSTLVVEMGDDILTLGGAADADGVLRGRACASSDKRLELLSLKQRREGDRLTLALVRERRVVTISFGADYAYHDVSVNVPPSIAVELDMGSGDATIQQVASLRADIGSGDLDARNISGTVLLEIGSGDAAIDQATSLTADIGSGSLDARNISGTLRFDVGSGDVVAHTIGTLQVDSVGSGDVAVDGVAAGTRIGTVGSGDVAVRDVKGAVTIESLGSGDITLQRVAGSVAMDRMGSGDLRVTDIEGDVVVNYKGSGDVHAKRVKGAVHTPAD